MLKLLMKNIFHRNLSLIPCAKTFDEKVMKNDCIIQEKYLGNFQSRFVYHHESLQQIEVYKNGQVVPQPSYLNDMDLTDENSLANDHWYRELLRNFPKAVDSISRVKFQKELFLFCFPFESTPKHLMNQDNGLNLITSGTIDLRLKFKSSLSSNKIIQIASFEKSLVQCDASGNILVN